MKSTVMRQDFGVGTVLKNGTIVTLTISSGSPPCCTVPDLTGMTVDKAKAALTNAHLKMGTQMYAPLSTEPADTVVSQNPPPGTHLNPGQPVDIVLPATSIGGGDHKKHHGEG